MTRDEQVRNLLHDGTDDAERREVHSHGDRAHSCADDQVWKKLEEFDGVRVVVEMSEYGDALGQPVPTIAGKPVSAGAFDKRGLGTSLPPMSRYPHAEREDYMESSRSAR